MRQSAPDVRQSAANSNSPRIRRRFRRKSDSLKEEEDMGNLDAPLPLLFVVVAVVVVVVVVSAADDDDDDQGTCATLDIRADLA